MYSYARLIFTPLFIFLVQQNERPLLLIVRLIVFLGKQLGSGEFGVVMKAEAQGISENETVTTVAVKMVRRTTNPTYVRALASELKIMVHLGKHLNVVNLLGACTKNISKRKYR